MKMIDFWDIAPYSPIEADRCFRGTYCLQSPLASYIALMMEAVRTSETSVYFNERTLSYIPESGNFHL
jgi:hypothetical protein